MAYNKTNWENSPSTNTPINSNNLNKIEEGIYSNSLKTDQIGSLSNLETINKTNLVGAINEVKEDLDNKQEKFIIENVTIATNRTISGEDALVARVPEKTGYTAYVLKPYVTGNWSDKYAVYVPWSGTDTIGIRNVSSNSYSWNIYCSVLYIKNEE